MKFCLSNFSMLGVMSSLTLSGCTLHQVAQFEEPVTPAAVRSAKELQVPPDLRATPALKPVVRPMAEQDLSRASLVPPVNASSAAITNLPASQNQAVANGQAPAKVASVAYAQSIPEKSPPTHWEVTPNYDFPWIAGALPDRVNEETTYGVGGEMFGRLFAKVAFGTEAMAKPPEPPAELLKEAAQKQKTTPGLMRWLVTENMKKNEPVVQREAPKPLTAATRVQAEIQS